MYLLRMKTWMRKAQKEEEEKNRYDDKHEYLHLRILREQQDARQS